MKECVAVAGTVGHPRSLAPPFVLVDYGMLGWIGAGSPKPQTPNP